MHTFLTTCGSFNLEIPSRFNRTTNEDAAPWLTPSILNTITKAQPMIDVFNRTIFDQLGFHDAFVTRSFETRFVLHFLFPFCYVNAINAAKHFNRKVYGEGNTKALLLELFSKRWRATRSGWPPSLDLGMGLAAEAGSPRARALPIRGRARPRARLHPRRAAIA